VQLLFAQNTGLKQELEIDMQGGKLLILQLCLAKEQLTRKVTQHVQVESLHQLLKPLKIASLHFLYILNACLYKILLDPKRLGNAPDFQAGEYDHAPHIE